jgi:hypothetical protein
MPGGRRARSAGQGPGGRGFPGRRRDGGLRKTGQGPGGRDWDKGDGTGTQGGAGRGREAKTQMRARAERAPPLPAPHPRAFPRHHRSMPRARSESPALPRSLAKAPSADGPKTGQAGRFSAHRHGLDGEVGRLAVEQNGVVTLAQLEGLGLVGEAISKRVTRGRLHRIRQAVYSLTPRVMTQRGMFMAAVLACGSDAVLSHGSAAYLWGLVDEWPDSIDVTAPNRRGRRSRR